MSKTARSDLPLTAIQANREMLERLAHSPLPIAKDAQRLLEILTEQEGQE